MLIWILIAIGLVVIVGGGFVGRSRQTRYRAQSEHAATHHDVTTGREPGGLGAGAGATEVLRTRPGGQAVGRRASSSWTLSKRIRRVSSASNPLSSRT